jgi:PAS domain S-box-containing protein
MASWNLKTLWFKKHETVIGGTPVDPPGNDQEISQRLPQICAAATCGIALLALVGWLTNIRLLAGQWGYYIPMAPLTALVFLLVGGALFGIARWPVNRVGRCLVIVVVSLVTLLSLLAPLLSTSNAYLGLVYALGYTHERLDWTPPGLMSPPIAILFLLESAFFLLFLKQTLRYSLTCAAFLALVVFAIGSVMLTGYAYGAPLLYGGTIIPVALPTALAFVLIGAGQMNLLVPRVRILRAWSGDSMRGRLLRAFLPSILLLVLVGDRVDVMIGEDSLLSPALWNSLKVLATSGLFVFIIGWVARRTGDAIENAHTQIVGLSRFPDENPSPVMRFARDGRLLYANRSSQPLLKCWQCERPGESLPQAEQKEMADIFEQGAIYDKEIACGETIYLLSLAPVVEMGYVNIYGRDITSSRKLEERLRADETLLSNAITLAQLAPWEYDPSAGAFIFNAHFYAMHATSVESEGGYVKTLEVFFKDFIHPDDINMMSEELLRGLSDRHRDYSRQIEYRILRRDGQIRHVATCFNATKDSAGQTVRLYGTTQDITHRKLAEIAIQESQQRLSNIMQFYPEATMGIDSAGKVIIWNRAIEKLTGVDASQMLGKGDHEYAVPLFGVRRPTLLNHVAKPGNTSIQGYSNVKWMDDVLNAEIEAGHLRGGKANLYITATAMRNLSGEVTGAIESIHDITEWKILTESLRANEKQLSGAIELADLSYWKYLVKESVFLFNNRLYASCGTTAEQEGGFCMSSEEYLGRLVHPEDMDMVAGEIKKALTSEDPDYSGHFDHRIIGRDGEMRTMAVSFSITRDAAGQPTIFYGISQDITHRKKHEQQYETIIRTSMDGFWLADMQGGLLDVNVSYCNMTGYSRAELLKMKISDVEVNERPQDIQDRIHRIEKTGGDRFETRHKRKDGSIIDIEISVTYLRDIGQMVVFARDITTRNLAEQKLQESQFLTAAVVENAPLMIFLKEAADLRFVMFNRAGEELLGYDRKDLLGKNNLDLFTSEQAAYFLAKDREVLDGESGMLDIPEETILTAKKGERLLHTRKVCIKGADGATKYLLGISEDITEPKQAEEKLLRSEIKFRTLYDSTSDAVMLLDEKGFFDCNKATLIVFGCKTKEEFCSKHPADVSPPTQPCGTDSLVLANQRIATAMERGCHRFEWVHRRVNTGECFPAEVLLTAMELDGRRALQATVRDITYHKQAEEELRSSREQLRLLLNSTGEGIYGVDTNGICTFHNPACLRLLGYKETDNLLGENMHMLIHHTDTEGRYIDLADCSIIKAINKGEGTHADDEIFWRADGTSFPVEYWAYPQIHDGVFVGVVVTFVDATDRKLLEKRSRMDSENIERHRVDLQAVFDAAPVGFLMVNQQAEVIQVNDVVAKMVGKDVASMLNRQPGDGLCCIHALAAPEGGGTGKECPECPIRRNLARVLQTGEAIHGLEVHQSLHIRGEDLLVWLLISMSPLTINGSPHVLIAITNITDQKRAEEEKRLAGAAVISGN